MLYAYTCYMHIHAICIYMLYAYTCNMHILLVKKLCIICTSSIHVVNITMVSTCTHWPHNGKHPYILKTHSLQENSILKNFQCPGIEVLWSTVKVLQSKFKMSLNHFLKPGVLNARFSITKQNLAIPAKRVA